MMALGSLFAFNEAGVGRAWGYCTGRPVDDIPTGALRNTPPLTNRGGRCAWRKLGARALERLAGREFEAPDATARIRPRRSPRGARVVRGILAGAPTSTPAPRPDLPNTVGGRLMIKQGKLISRWAT